MVKQRKWHQIFFFWNFKECWGVNKTHKRLFDEISYMGVGGGGCGLRVCFYYLKERETLPKSNNFDFHLLFYNQSNCSSELSVKNVPKLCPWTGSWKLTLYDKSFNCSILMNERKELFFAFDPHGRCCQNHGEGGMVGGPAKWWPLSRVVYLICG